MNFYILKGSDRLFGPNWAYPEHVEPHITGDGDKCPLCGGPISMREWLPPRNVKMSTSKLEKWGDLAWGTVWPFMVSERFRTIWQNERLKGIVDFLPVNIVKVGNRRTGDVPEGLMLYYQVKLVWGAANLDDAASQVVPRESPCPYHRGAFEELHGVYLEEGTWDGSDLFEARGLPGQVVASERFGRMVMEHEITNARLIPAEKYEWNDHVRGLWWERE